jgi:hypothetical protein
MEDVEKAKTVINHLADQIDQSHATPSESSEMAETLAAISFMIGGSLGKLARYEAIFEKYGIEER